MIICEVLFFFDLSGEDCGQSKERGQKQDRKKPDQQKLDKKKRATFDRKYYNKKSGR